MECLRCSFTIFTRRYSDAVLECCSPEVEVLRHNIGLAKEKTSRTCHPLQIQSQGSKMLRDLAYILIFFPTSFAILNIFSKHSVSCDKVLQFTLVCCSLIIHEWWHVTIISLEICIVLSCMYKLSVTRREEVNQIKITSKPNWCVCNFIPTHSVSQAWCSKY